MTTSEYQISVHTNKNIKILYVEDNQMVRESTFYILEEFFDYIDTAKDGHDGLQKYQQFFDQNAEYYDIIITDINMPRMNGIEMIKAIQTIHKEQHIIVISAHNESDHLIELINIGISNFILKPIDINHFQEVVYRVTTAIESKKKLQNYHHEMEKINISLTLAKEDAEVASEHKSQFLANMSHEIRTPLNAITGFISLLGKNEKDEERLKYLKIIRNSSDSLLKIINDILDISKIESGKLAIDPVNFNPYDDLILIAELFQAKAAEKDINFKIKYNANIPKILYSDSLRIKQILTNLLSNAVKFTPENSMVTCIIWYAKGQLNIRVKDYGIGIPKEKEKYMFKSFSQVDTSIVRKYGGTGLGLSISKKLAQMLDGDLTYKSNKKRGSIFTLKVPMPLGKEKILDHTQTSNKPLSGHILLVEDNEANQMFVGIVLKNAGITYEIAHNGIVAIEKFKTGSYDLILMDENMPKLGGIAAAKAILKIEEELQLHHTPIISLTANALKGDKERFLEAGMDDYLSKPIEPVKLTQTIGKFIAK